MNTPSQLGDQLQAAAGYEPKDGEVWPAGRAVLFMLLVSLAMWGSILALVSSLFE